MLLRSRHHENVKLYCCGEGWGESCGKLADILDMQRVMGLQKLNKQDIQTLKMNAEQKEKSKYRLERWI
jgi:hypothetical protein